LPASAPTSVELESSLRKVEPLGYRLIPVDERVAAVLGSYTGARFGANFVRNGYAPGDALHPGDVVTVTVYEAGPSTLFQAPGSTVQAPNSTTVGLVPSSVSTIPPQVIEANGTIMVPFVGRMKMAGETPAQAAAKIQEALVGKAVQPQVIVTPVSTASSTATVGGDVNQPRQVPLTLRGERLLDVIALAGGSKYPPFETYVRVVRHGRVGLGLLQTSVTSPDQNIRIQPGDQVFLTHNPRTFAVLGATMKVSQYTFDTEKVTVAEALARAGGPIDAAGSPSGVYLFRFEPKFIVKNLTPADRQPPAKSSYPDFLPVLYRFDFRDARNYFLAQTIQMRDKDIILVTNAEATQLQKALAVVRGFTGIAYDLGRAGTAGN
jgi:polysaccharide export outer membrane protein